jgi:hypothetical protein
MGFPTKPSGLIVINKTHPLNRGLKLCFCPAHRFDHATNLADGVVPGFSGSITKCLPSPAGMSIVSAGSITYGNHASLRNTALVGGAREFTISMVLGPPITATQATTAQTFLLYNSTHNEKEIGIRRDSTSNKITLGMSAWGGAALVYQDLAATNTFITQSTAHYIFTRTGVTGSDSLNLYTGGSLDTTATVNTSAVTATTWDSAACNFSAAVAGFPGVYDFRMWNRVLTGVEIKSLFANPWAMYKRPQPYIRGLKPTSSFPYYYRNLYRASESR